MPDPSFPPSGETTAPSNRLRRLRIWLDVGQYDRLERADDPPEWRWAPHDWLKRAGLAVLCRLLGHQPEPDHCLMPAHDRCRWCGLLMPGQAPRPLPARGSGDTTDG